jgi:beta-glucosidase
MKGYWSSPEHREMARKIADESMVLLKNDGTLPLKTSGIKIAVIGPLVDRTKVLLGNYNGSPTHTVSILEGLRKEFAGASDRYVPGTQFLSHDANPVPASALTTGGKPGIRVSYSKFDTSDINHPEATKPLAHATALTVDVSDQPLPAEVANVHPLSIHWDGELTAPETGDYNLGLKGNGRSSEFGLMARTSPPHLTAIPTKPNWDACTWRPASPLPASRVLPSR